MGFPDWPHNQLPLSTLDGSHKREQWKTGVLFLLVLMHSKPPDTRSAAAGMGKTQPAWRCLTWNKSPDYTQCWGRRQLCFAAFPSALHDAALDLAHWLLPVGKRDCKNSNWCPTTKNAELAQLQLWASWDGKFQASTSICKIRTLN